MTNISDAFERPKQRPDPGISNIKWETVKDWHKIYKNT